MERVRESQEVAFLVPDVDLNARVVYFPIRHHSPACAWHVNRLIRQIRPDAVLIEGPRNAGDLAPLLLDHETTLPVAIFTTFIKREKDSPPQHFGAYYPFCDYSPELAALKAARDVNAVAKFIDLPFADQAACRRWPDGKVQSLLEESYLRHSRRMQAACQRSGARDADDLWDHLYEDDYESLPTADFMRNVLAYCALARADHNDEMLAADGTLAREQAMASEIARETGRTLVVTGGFHTVALPETEPTMHKLRKTDASNSLAVLIPYTFEMLDRLNGYASGMPAPEFYQRRWEGQEASKLLVDVGRRARKHGGEVSAADEIAALAHATRLAVLRGHRSPSREDLLDGIRSCFVKGAIDLEGVQLLAHARLVFAGARAGAVPKSAGAPPIVWDFRESAQRFNLKLDGYEAHTVTLDVYRNKSHRLLSRFLFRLSFLENPLAKHERGPDFVAGKNLDSVQEVWSYRWFPEVDSHLVTQSIYGSTLEMVAIARLWIAFDDATKTGTGGRARLGTALIMEASRMGLHRQASEFVAKTAELIAEDGLLHSVASALNDLLIMNNLREPLDAGEIDGLDDLAASAYRRACNLLGELRAVPEEDEQATLEALCSLDAARKTMEVDIDGSESIKLALSELCQARDASPALQGGAVGLLASNGWMETEEAMRQVNGRLSGAGGGIEFVRGLLATYRSLLWQTPDILAGLTSTMLLWDEEQFLKNLPLLRLTFADLGPRECDHVARILAETLGIAKVSAGTNFDMTQNDMRHGEHVNRLVAELLRKDGLSAILEQEEAGREQ